MNHLGPSPSPLRIVTLCLDEFLRGHAQGIRQLADGVGLGAALVGLSRL